VVNRKRAGSGRRARAGPMIHNLERHAEQARAAREQLAVGDHHDARRQTPPREPNAQVGPDARGLARRYRNQWNLGR
jgi:hypothetical protein